MRGDKFIEPSVFNWRSVDGTSSAHGLLHYLGYHDEAELREAVAAQRAGSLSPSPGRAAPAQAAASWSVAAADAAAEGGAPPTEPARGESRKLGDAGRLGDAAERALRRSRMSDEELLLLESSRVDEAMIEALAADAGGVFRLPLAQTAAQYVEEVRANAQYVVNERARHETVLGWQGGAETQQVRRRRSPAPRGRARAPCACCASATWGVRGHMRILFCCSCAWHAHPPMLVRV